MPIDIYIYLGKGDTEKPEHKKQNEMEEYLEKARDLSFEGIKDIIKYHTVIIPITFRMGSASWNIWRKNEKLDL